MKFLFDECLSPELTKLAHAKGYGESTHVVWLGRGLLLDIGQGPPGWIKQPTKN
jgi:hypothetical protein